MCNYEFPPIGGGGSPVARDITLSLAQLGHEIDVVTMAFRGLPRQERLHRRVTIHRVPCWRRHKHICTTPEMATYLLPALRRCLQLHRQRRYDVCHTHFIFPSGPVAWGLRKLTGLPYVITSHGSDVPGYNPDRFAFQHRLLLPVWRRVVASASAITFPSAFLRDLFLKSACRHPQLVVIPNGIYVDQYPPSTHENIILFVGRLVPRKGGQFLLECLVDVELRGWEVHIVGDGPMRPEVERLAAQMKTRTVVHGWLDHDSEEFRRLRRTASIFAFPTLMENFSMVLLEAMASGMAIVTTRVGGNPEVVGDAAALVEPGDWRSLREAIARLVRDREARRALGEAARRRAQQNFSWPGIAARYAGLLSRVARAGPQVMEGAR